MSQPNKAKPLDGIPGVTAMIKLMTELAGIMDQEIVLVNGRQQPEHAVLLKRKQRLTLDYRAGMKSLSAQGVLKQLPQELHESLKSAAMNLSEASDRNAKTLRTAVLATQRLVQNIVSIVKQEALTKPGYINPTTAHLALGTYSPTCKPVALNRTV